MKYNQIQVEDCRIFYREAGNPEKPTVLLLHGFPSSSHMFRELMPELAGEYHLIAPDFPAFGQTDSPDREHFTYSFDHLARIVDKFTEAIGLTKFAMYVFDYGAPIGYRLAMWHPERITAIISQNGNMYEEGLGKKWEARGRILQTNFASSLHRPMPSRPSSDNTLSEPLKAQWVPTAIHSITTMSASQAAPRCRMTSFSTIARTLPSTLSFRSTSVPTSPHCWLYGERTTLRSSLKVPKPSSATCPMPRYISYPADTSHSKAITRRLPN